MNGKLLCNPATIGLCALLTGPLTGCPDDDAGDVAFVKQVVPAVLGRRVHNAAEFEVLVDLAATVDREAVVDLLMQRPEFIEYWERVLFEKLRALDPGAVPAEMTGCIDAPLLDVHDGSLAAHIAANDTSVPFPGGKFNLRDVLRSAVAADDLRPAVLASVLTMASAINDRQDAGNRFMEVFLDRNGACMECHNSMYSKTDEWSGWTRHAPLPFDLDGDIWGRSSSACADHPYDGYFARVQYLGGNGAAAYTDLGCDGCHDGNGSGPEHRRLLPLLSDAQIIQAVREGFPDPQRNMPAYATPAAGEACDGAMDCLSDADLQRMLEFMRAEFGDFVGCADWNATYAYFDLNNDCREGKCGGAQVSLALPPWGMSGSCGYHRSKVDLGATATVAGELDQSALGLVAALGRGADAIATDLASGPTTSVLADPPRASASELGSLGDPALAFAYAVAAGLADAIGQELTGSSMRVAHGYSRNSAQREVLLLGIAELLGDPTGTWSLKRIVREWVLSLAFNRSAPQDSSATEPYLLVQLFDPWFEPHPDSTAVISASDGVGKNGMGEVVHRFSVNNLFLQLHHAMGWPAPDLRVAQDVSYPPAALRRALGQPLSANVPGFDEVTFQALLAWEDAYGNCARPASVAHDWIDELMSSAARDGATILDGVQAVKMRLLQESADADELAALAPLFPAYALTQAMSRSNTTTVEAGLRRYCGVLLTSPQFLLARVTPASDVLPTSPTLSVCPPGEPCTRDAVYCGFADDLATIDVGWVPAWWPGSCK